MGLKNVMRYLQKQAHVTPVTAEKNQALQQESSVYAGCTAVTSVTSQIDEHQDDAQFVPTGEVSNDPDPPTSPPPTAPTTAAPAPRGSGYQRWRDAWQQQADAYYGHHFTCPVCIASGKGYGARCGVGAVLWLAYTDASNTAGDAP